MFLTPLASVVFKRWAALCTFGPVWNRPGGWAALTTRAAQLRLPLVLRNAITWRLCWEIHPPALVNGCPSPGGAGMQVPALALNPCPSSGLPSAMAGADQEFYPRPA